MDSEEVPVYREVEEFGDWLSTEGIDLPWNEVLDQSEFARDIAHEIEAAASSSIPGTLWRGRRFRPGEKPDGSEALGPPPPGKGSVGRFNEDGHPVLYCARARHVVPDEVPPDDEKPDLWVQAFEVDAGEMAVLKLDTELAEDYPLLHNLLFLAERQAKKEELYRLTHLIHELCRGAGIVAIEYPSVATGYRNDPEAINLVVFDEGIDVVTAAACGEPEPMQGQGRALTPCSGDIVCGRRCRKRLVDRYRTTV